MKVTVTMELECSEEEACSVDHWVRWTLMDAMSEFQRARGGRDHYDFDGVEVYVAKRYPEGAPGGNEAKIAQVRERCRVASLLHGSQITVTTGVSANEEKP